MTLPGMDVPVGTVYWEVFVPDNYSVRETGGNVIDRRTYSPVLIADRGTGAGYGHGGGSATGPGSAALGGGVSACSALYVVIALKWAYTVRSRGGL
jgi:hypothetical protein